MPSTSLRSALIAERPVSSLQSRPKPREAGSSAARALTGGEHWTTVDGPTVSPVLAISRTKAVGS